MVQIDGNTSQETLPNAVMLTSKICHMSCTADRHIMSGGWKYGIDSGHPTCSLYDTAHSQTL